MSNSGGAGNSRRRERISRRFRTADAYIGFFLASLILLTGLVWFGWYLTGYLGWLQGPSVSFAVGFPQVLQAALLVIVALELAETLISENIIHLVDALVYAVARKTIVEGELALITLVGLVLLLGTRVLMSKTGGTHEEDVQGSVADVGPDNGPRV